MEKYEYKVIKREKIELNNFICLGEDSYHGKPDKYGYPHIDINSIIDKRVNKEKKRCMGSTYFKTIDGNIKEIPYKKEDFEYGGMVESEMRKEVEDYCYKNTTMGLEIMLNELGQQGWELISCQNNEMIFKRVK